MIQSLVFSLLTDENSDNDEEKKEEESKDVQKEVEHRGDERKSEGKKGDERKSEEKSKKEDGREVEGRIDGGGEIEGIKRMLIGEEGGMKTIDIGDMKIREEIIGSGRETERQEGWKGRGKREGGR